MVLELISRQNYRKHKMKIVMNGYVRGSPDAGKREWWRLLRMNKISIRFFDHEFS
jgi:hypothetical protein